MKGFILISGMIVVLASCNYDDKSNGNIDAAFRSDDSAAFGGNIHKKELDDPANWVYEKKIPNNNKSGQEDTLTTESL